MESVVNKIKEKIIKSGRGGLFFADDFARLGTSANIRKVLSRLEKDNLLVRLAQGIYLKPKQDPLLGVVYPNIEEIANQIANRDKARIAPTGVLALYLLGLTTQVPLKAVYLTDGSQRDIKIGKRTIKFKHTVPKSFAIKDGLLHLVVSAFKEQGQEGLSEEFLSTIKHSVKKIEKQVLDSQLKYAPVWIQKEINKLYQS
ncbi:DUF6088 family protein [Sphingobacterium athyrii]|uniref:DUF6088 family protein n=1 Tax=Sphingobacterium athyrii TaxID=2152717 RepID=UPI0028B02CAE|nr:DUF6088 family protein [Sphingobacterium athyrii]